MKKYVKTCQDKTSQKSTEDWEITPNPSVDFCDLHMIISSCCTLLFWYKAIRNETMKHNYLRKLCLNLAIYNTEIYALATFSVGTHIDGFQVQWFISKTSIEKWFK